LKYLGFLLKPDNYEKRDWKWLIAKVEKRLYAWYNHWLSRGGRLVPNQISSQSNIGVIWRSLAFIPKCIMENLKKLSSKFLWYGSIEKSGTALVKWQALTL